MLQSPDLAKVKEELSRLQKRQKAGTKLVEEKQKLHKEQSQLSSKLQADLENVTDGAACGTCTHMKQYIWQDHLSPEVEADPVMPARLLPTHL